jgi:hypothetical protein
VVIEGQSGIARMIEKHRAAEPARCFRSTSMRDRQGLPQAEIFDFGQSSESFGFFAHVLQCFTIRPSGFVPRLD